MNVVTEKERASLGIVKLMAIVTLHIFEGEMQLSGNIFYERTGK